MQPTHVMIVEDERIVALHLKQQLQQLGYAVNGIASNGTQALVDIKQNRPDVVLMDIRIDGDMDGIETAARIEDIPVIYLTAYSEDATLERAGGTRPFGYLVKPVSERELHATIQMSLKRREVETALRDSRELLGLALDAAEMGSWELDESLRQINRDGNARRITGAPPEAAAASLAEFCEDILTDDRPTVTEEFDRLLREHGSLNMEFRYARSAADIRWLRAQGKAFRPGLQKKRRIVGVIRDITEEIEHERRQRILERIGTIGTLASGIAHDVNNMLTPILNLTLLVKETLPENDPGRSHLDIVLEAGHRIETLVAHVLSFNRRDQRRPEPLDLRGIVRGVITIVRDTMPASVTINQRLARDVGLINAIPSQIDSILVNLIVNAVQATAPMTGRVDVTLERIEGASAPAAGTSDPAPPPHARITVSDNGSGMDAATLEHIFEPFFTTKPAGKGTGLGLSVVCETVKSLGGSIQVESEPGVGTTFSVLLPLLAVQPR